MTDIIDELNEKFKAGQTIIRGRNVSRLLARAFELRSQLEEVQATLTDCLKSEEALRDQLEAVTNRPAPVVADEDDRPWIDATKLDPDGNRDVEILVYGKKRLGWHGTDEWRIYTERPDYVYANDLELTVTHWREISE